MPQFILSGTSLPSYRNLDEFTQAYIETAFFTEEEQLGEQYFQDHQVEPMGTDSRYKPGFEDLSAEAYSQMVDDCAKFQDQCGGILQDANENREVAWRDSGGFQCSLATRAGRDFWLTRNGHGCGFWDGDWPEPYATKLDEAAKAFGSCDLYVGDDQLVYCL